MQSDEQRMREQFEKWIDEKQYGLGWQDGRGTWEEFLSATWAGYKAGQLARDAEVQALRDVNNQLHRMVSFFASSIKSGEQWSAYHEEEMAALRAAHEEVVDAD